MSLADDRSVPSSRPYTTPAAATRVRRAGLTARGVSTYRSQIRTHVHHGKGRGGPGLLVATAPDSQVCSGGQLQQLKTAHLRPYLVCGGRQDRGTPAGTWRVAAGDTGGRRLCWLPRPARLAAEQRKLELPPDVAYGSAPGSGQPTRSSPAPIRVRHYLHAVQSRPASGFRPTVTAA